MSALGRTEWLLLAGVSAAATLLHAAQVDWLRFILAFALIDAVGYWPGALAVRKAGGGLTSPVYVWLYNLTHNFVTGAVACAAWALLNGGLEWAMLAIPLHLAGDRGLFGNGFKRSDEPFEPLAPRSRIA